MDSQCESPSTGYGGPAYGGGSVRGLGAALRGDNERELLNRKVMAMPAPEQASSMAQAVQQLGRLADQIEKDQALTREQFGILAEKLNPLLRAPGPTTRGLGGVDPDIAACGDSALVQFLVQFAGRLACLAQNERALATAIMETRDRLEI